MPVDYRISKLGGAIAITIALLIDLLQIGLDLVLLGGIINPFIITPIAWLSFWTWFKIKGVKFSEPKNVTAVAIGAIIELIPYVDVLPGNTLAVARIIFNTRVDDANNQRA